VGVLGRQLAQIRLDLERVRWSSGRHGALRFCPGTFFVGRLGRLRAVKCKGTRVAGRAQRACHAGGGVSSLMKTRMARRRMRRPVPGHGAGRSCEGDDLLGVCYGRGMSTLKLGGKLHNHQANMTSPNCEFRGRPARLGDGTGV
jgi:hypothetical protein